MDAMTREYLEAKRTLIRRQLAEMMSQGDPTVTCGCGRRCPVRLAFRCFFCGETFCPACARAHFGERPQHDEPTVQPEVAPCTP